MKKLKTGILGMGYIGASHIDAVRRIPECELWAVADANEELARRKAEYYQVPKCYASIDALLEDPEIEVIHNCTPNNLHTEINKKILAAGKHLLSEKPLALNFQEAQSLLEVHRAHPVVGRRERVDQGRAVVGAAVVHEQQLQVAKRLAQHAVRRGAQRPCGVVDRHDHADLWRLFHGVTVLP